MDIINTDNAEENIVEITLDYMISLKMFIELEYGSSIVFLINSNRIL